jgi:hypothetical protein
MAQPKSNSHNQEQLAKFKKPTTTAKPLTDDTESNTTNAQPQERNVIWLRKGYKRWCAAKE